jgi:hypothetical protein
MTNKSKLAIIGGIKINMEGEGTDLFLPLKFEIRTLQQSFDLLPQIFGSMYESQANTYRS